MKISARVVCHPGNCREKNEDNFCFNGRKLVGNATLRPIKFYGESSTPVLMGVFDGMGGIKAGEVASRIATDVACLVLSVFTINIFNLTAAILYLCIKKTE